MEWSVWFHLVGESGTSINHTSCQCDIAGEQVTILNSDSDANNIATSGTYYWASGTTIPQNMPALNGGGKMVVVAAANFLTQIVYPGYYDTNNRSKTYKREAWVVNENRTFSAWAEM